MNGNRPIWLAIGGLVITIVLAVGGVAVTFGGLQADVETNTKTLDLREFRFQAIEGRVGKVEQEQAADDVRNANIVETLNRIETAVTANRRTLDTLLRGRREPSPPIPGRL